MMGAKTVRLLALGAIVLVALSTVFFQVRTSEYAVVLRFGRPVQVIRSAGLRMKLPWPIDRVARFDRRLLVFDLPGPGEPARELLTSDKKNVEVSTYACWRIEDPLRFLQTVGTRAGAEAYLRDVVVSELGKQMGRHPLSALLSVDPEDLRGEQIAAEVDSACNAAAARECGVTVSDFRIKRINLPEQNRESVFERMRAERKQIATRYRSEGQQEATAIRADADRQKAEILAASRQQALEIQGRSEAEAARIYNQAYGRDRRFYRFLRTLSSYDKTLTDKATILLPRDMDYLKLLSDPQGLGRIRQETADSSRADRGSP
jgi:membrane protease subunit HflC